MEIQLLPIDDSVQMEKKIVELLTSAVKDNIKNNRSQIATVIGQINELARYVKKEIADELDKTTDKLQKNLSDIFPEHNIDIEPQAEKLEVDKLLAAGTYLNVAASDGKYYPLANQGVVCRELFCGLPLRHYLIQEK